MLSDLLLENLATFDRAAIELGTGLNALTGETGAGKSLVVGALELLQGQRPRTGIVRTGAAEARVEGRFLLTAGEAGAGGVVAALGEVAPAVLEDWQALGEDDEREIVLARAVGAGGRSRAWINHRPATLAALQRIAALLVEIHGQNDHQRLFEPEEQARLLDAFGGTAELAQALRAARREHAAARGELEAFDQRSRERTERIDLLRFQARELEAGRTTPEEHGELIAERDRLRWAAELGRDLGEVQGALAGDDGGALEGLRRARRVLASWSQRVASVAPLAAEIEQSLAHAEEAAAGLERFAEGLTPDPARLEAVEERLYRLETLRAKHRTDLAGLIARAGAIAAELAQLEAGAETVELLASRVEKLEARAESLATELARKRSAAAARLAKAVHQRLAELGLEKARFSWSAVNVPRQFAAPAPDAGTSAVNVPRQIAAPAPDGGAQRGRPDESTARSDALAPATAANCRGTFTAEFYLAANPGEPARPLRHVASGGEAARILLAIRVALALRQSVPTLVFDEIDAGVGGRLGPQVGEHLRELGRGHQVVCVTHLPAIAALADRHFRVEKAVKGGRTRTEVALLDGDRRIDEVADMIAGGKEHASARAEARRLLGARSG